MPLGIMLFLSVVVGASLVPVSRAEAVQSQRAVISRDSMVSASLPPASLPPGALAGTYTLTLVARSGDRAGNRTEGAVQLVRSDSADRGRRPDGTTVAPAPAIDNVLPLYGWADVTLADVGAIASRDPRTRDPIYPGVLVLLGPPRGATTGWGLVLVALGSMSRDGSQTLDAPTTSLYATRVDSAGMWGRWTSGGLSQISDGYFCLRRMRP